MTTENKMGNCGKKYSKVDAEESRLPRPKSDYNNVEHISVGHCVIIHTKWKTVLKSLTTDVWTVKECDRKRLDDLKRESAGSFFLIFVDTDNVYGAAEVLSVESVNMAVKWVFVKTIQRSVLFQVNANLKHMHHVERKNAQTIMHNLRMQQSNDSLLHHVDDAITIGDITSDDSVCPETDVTGPVNAHTELSALMNNSTSQHDSTKQSVFVNKVPSGSRTNTLGHPVQRDSGITDVEAINTDLVPNTRANKKAGSNRDSSGSNVSGHSRKSSEKDTLLNAPATGQVQGGKKREISGSSVSSNSTEKSGQDSLTNCSETSVKSGKTKRKRRKKSNKVEVVQSESRDGGKKACYFVRTHSNLEESSSENDKIIVSADQKTQLESVASDDTIIYLFLYTTDKSMFHRIGVIALDFTETSSRPWFFRLFQSTQYECQVRWLDDEYSTAEMNLYDIVDPSEMVGEGSLIKLSPKDGENVRTRMYEDMDKRGDAQFGSLQKFPQGRRMESATGLRNLGNTCYMNCILQCLSKTAQLQQYCSENSRASQGVRAEFIHLMNALTSQHPDRPVDPSRLRGPIVKFSDRFSGQGQQDAHEFLLYFFGRLDVEFQKSEPQTIFQTIFEGRVDNRYKFCCDTSVDSQRFYTLSLPIPPESVNSCTLEQCFDEYVKDSAVDNLLNCPICNDLVTCNADRAIKSFPDVLILYLNRYKVMSGAKHQRYAKVEYTEQLDLTFLKKSEDAVEDGKSCVYNLYGVCHHHGSTQFGHYTATVKNVKNNQWYSYSDSSVVECKKPLSEEAFMLFYERKSTSVLK